MPAMKSRFAIIVLWLFVINLGIALGAGMYEARVVIPAWGGTPPQTWPNTGLLFWVYVTTVPLTLLTIANAAAAWRDEPGARRSWWRGAVAIVAVDRIATFTYFIPAMIELSAAEGLSQPEVDARLAHWLFVNHGRHLLAISGLLAALKAFSLQGKPARG